MLWCEKWSLGMDSRRPAKDEAILTGIAESIGATLGTIAAKASSVQKTLADKVTEVKPRVRRATKAVAKKGANLRPARARVGKTRAASRTARRTRKKS
jgi:hypothetical protein